MAFLAVARPVALRAGALFAVVFLAAVFFAGAFLAGAFFAVVFLAGAFFAAVFLAAVFFAVVFFAAVFFAVDLEDDAERDVVDLAAVERLLVVEDAAAALGRESVVRELSWFFSVAPAAKAMPFEAGMRTAAPVCGLRPVRAALLRSRKVPKPVMRTASPPRTADVISKIAWSIAASA